MRDDIRDRVGVQHVSVRRYDRPFSEIPTKPHRGDRAVGVAVVVLTLLLLFI